MNLKTYRAIKNEPSRWKVDPLSNNLLNGSITEDLTKNLTLNLNCWQNSVFFFLFKADTVFSIYLNLIAIDKKIWCYIQPFKSLFWLLDNWKAIFIDGEGAIYCSLEKLKWPQITMEQTYSILSDVSYNFSTTNSDQTSAILALCQLLWALVSIETQKQQNGFLNSLTAKF